MAGPPVRERYNAKARGSVAGGKSHKKGKRKARPDDDDEQDEPTRQPHHVPGMSSKKKKRLDSYIAKKLMLERRDKTLKELAAMQDSNTQILSTATLGQNPFAPSSTAERLEKLEDKLARRGIERLKKRYGDAESDSDSGEEDARHSGPRRVEVVNTAAEEKEAIETTVLESKSEKKAREKAAALGVKGKLQMPKKANWNPSQAKALHKSDSSDFDSSDADSDESEGEAEAPGDNSGAQDISTKSVERPSETKPTPGSALKASFGSALKASDGQPKSSVAGSALKSSVAGSALKSSVAGSALKAGAQPRIVKRGPKKFAPVRRQAPGSSDEEESSSDDEDTDTDDSDQDSDEDDESSDDDSDDHGSEAGADEVTDQHTDPETRSKGFKSWAMKAVGTSLQSPATDLLASHNDNPRPKTRAPKTGEFVGPMGATMTLPATSLLPDDKNATARPILKRRPSVVESRMNLPVLAEEQSIVESILMNPVVVICGETGSGKTTQVPQMLYEAGFGFPGSSNPGMIAVTQPRRVAAISLAERVRDEMGLSAKSRVVAHQIRYSSTSAAETAIKFMTDGVLLRELATDFLLSRYSVVVVDEAHERGVNTDVLIGVLSRVAKLREKRWRETKDQTDRLSPLRIVIMSATLRVADFAENATLFATPPPVIHIGARQHPVTVHFSRRTPSDYVTEAYKKVCKIHSRLPPGTVLVFMTGQSEIMTLCRKLEKKYGKSNGVAKPAPVKEEGMLNPDVMEVENIDIGADTDLAADVDDGIAESDPEGLDTDDDEPELFIEEESNTPMTVLPLYSLLPQEQQMAVFKPPPEGHRLVIVATNVAETSLTIPGVRYVVDSGRAKERQYDAASGVQTFAVSWISKASASQRAGRAGRTGPGHCYRLYSSALFEDHFASFSQPEILRMPIEGVVLNMKAMNIDAVTNFPFPTPPDRQALSKAEALLQHLGALDKAVAARMVAGVQRDGVAGGRITDLGRAMAQYPVSPRFAKMLVAGAQNNVLEYIIAIVAGLSVGDPFIHENTLDVASDEEGSDDDRAAELANLTSEKILVKEKRKDLRSRFFKRTGIFHGNGESDMFKLLSAIGAYDFNPTATFCNEYFLRPKAMQEIQQLRSQISNIANVTMSQLKLPSDKQRKLLRQILTAGFIDQVAVLESIVSKKGGSNHASSRGIPYRATGVPEPVYIHPSSVLFRGTPAEYIVFTELVRTSRVYVKGVTKIQPEWLAVLGKDMCSFSRAVEAPGTKAKLLAGGKEREVFVVPHFGDLGVDLPPVKQMQRREGTRWVTVE